MSSTDITAVSACARGAAGIGPTWPLPLHPTPRCRKLSAAAAWLPSSLQRLPALHVCHTLQASQCGCRCPSAHAICIAPARLRNSLAQMCATPPLSSPFSFSFFMQPAKARCSCVLRARSSAVAAAARITQPAATDTAHAISHDDVVLVRGGCGLALACHNNPS